MTLEEPEIIDRQSLAVLETAFDHNNLILADLVATFCQDAQQLVTEALNSYTEEKIAACHRAVHSLRSNALSMGATQLARVASELEQIMKVAKKEGTTPATAVPLLTRLPIELDKTIDALLIIRQEYLNPLTPQ